ncbi:MAG: invasion associated locus B family protein [Proteobacteria bacterium]|nr:invasion associated locus B family protein [Pseudomonadota bacterium]
MPLSRLRATLAPALALAVISPFALAQDQSVAPAQAVPKWLVNCTNTGADGALQCNMSQSVVLTATGARILSVTIQKPGGQDDPTMMVTLPHGLFLPTGVRMSIDSEARKTLEVQTCEAAGCYAGLVIEPALLEALRMGNEFTFVIKDMQKRDITLTLTLDGFADSYATLPRSPIPE